MENHGGRNNSLMAEGERGEKAAELLLIGT
jgi:hypothetical protein